MYSVYVCVWCVCVYVCVCVCVCVCMHACERAQIALGYLRGSVPFASTMYMCIQEAPDTVLGGQLSAMLDNRWTARCETIILTIFASVVDGEPKETYHPARPVVCQLR